MFETKAQKITLGIIIFMMITIPATSYVISFRFKAQTKAKASFETTNLTPSQAPLRETPPQNTEATLETTPFPTPTSIPVVSFGPTLKFALKIQGRPENNQSAKTFIGVAQGKPVQMPQYLLSFTVDTPVTGIYSGLSLAGLTVGEQYTAYIKGPAQIVSSAEFTLKTNESDLGLVSLKTGDLNDDNAINNLDYSIIKSLYGTTSGSQSWNPNADFNVDGVINNLDISIVLSNLGETGSSGIWVSSPVATKSGQLKGFGNIGAPAEELPVSGYWLWIPKTDIY